MTLKVNLEYALRHTFVVIVFLGLATWFGYDGLVTYPRTDAAILYEKIEGEKPGEGVQLESFKQQKIKTQNSFSFACGLVGLIVLLRLLATIRRRRITFDDQQVNWNGQVFSYSDITAVRDDKWETSQICVLDVKGKRFVIDGWHYVGADQLREKVLASKGELPRVLFLNPDLHTLLWGTESWEISVHPKGPTSVARGSLKGKLLSDLLPDFPLLIKVIDAKMKLSVQVHPNETTCKVTGGDPKTEMWCLLEDGSIYAGLKPGVGPQEINQAIESGEFEKVLVKHEGHAGDTFFIPGGLVHAIDAGTKLYEVQQSSNTTFRLYDWGRVGADGKPRELHIAQSLKAIDYTLEPPKPQKEVDSPFFNFKVVHLQGKTKLATGEGPTILFAAKGDVTIFGEEMKEGTSAFVPKGGELELQTASSALIFVSKSK